jgi:electron transfer flavoprotein beta subunit
MSMKIAVLVSAGKHPVSGQPRHCRNDSLALQIGLNLTQSLAADLTVLHAGEPSNAALQDYLALGASQINVVPATGDTVENLAAQLQNTELILTGTRAENGEDSGLLPYLLAAKLNLPIVADALEITQSENQLEILQFLPKGQRRRVMVSLPAVVAVHPSAVVALNFIYARQNLGSISTLPASNTTTKPSQWRLEKTRKPIKLVASAALTGHERLMAAISSKAKGGAVVNEGNNVEKAQVILHYLREHQLIDF